MINIFKSKLFGKIFVLVILAIMIVLFVFAIRATSLQKESILDALYSKAKSVADSISFVKEDAMIIDNEIDLLEFVLDFVKSDKDILSFSISRKNGNTILIKKNSWSLLNQKEKIHHKNENRAIYRIEESKYIKDRVFKFIYPIKISGILWGYYDIELSLSEYNKKIENMYSSFVYLAIIMVILSLILAYIIASIFTKPVMKLSVISEDIASGNLSKRVEIDRNDELGMLAKSFNNMVTHLEKSQLQLQQSHDDLEDRVHARTQELQISNKLLEEKSNELLKVNENLENTVFSEIEKRRRQEQLLIQQSKLAAMGEMIGNIAHQWRQPLNALSLVLQNLDFSYKMGELDDEFMDKSLKKSDILISSMSKTIDDFRNFFKPNKEKKIFCINQNISKSLSLVDSTFANNNIKLIYEIADNIDVFGFANEFSQVILNILTNAKDALLDNKIANAIVKIYIEYDKDYVFVYIEDNAGGIPNDIIDKIYTPYFTTKDEGKGTGIGLYMSKTIIEDNMEGQLSVENVEAGARFKIKIPIYKEDM